MKLIQAILIACTVTVAAAAQNPQRSRAEAPAAAQTENAYQTRDRLQELLRQYPPSLSDVFRLDPSLLTNDAFMAAYPNVSAFMKQHPEVGRDPAFFLGPFERERAADRRQRAIVSNIRNGDAGYGRSLGRPPG